MNRKMNENTKINASAERMAAQTLRPGKSQKQVKIARQKQTFAAKGQLKALVVTNLGGK